MLPSKGLLKLLRRLPDSLSGRLIRLHFWVDRPKADGFRFKVADTREELESAYRLTHDVYVKEGYSDPAGSGLRVNLRYPLPTTATFIGSHRDRVAITMTIMGDSPLGLPMDMVFSRELYQLRRQGRRIAEVGAFASQPGFRRRQQVLAMYANKIMWNYAVHNLLADDLVIAVNPKHEWVYKHLLLFESLSRQVKSYAFVKDAPAIAMRLDLRTARERYAQAYRRRPPGRSLLHFFLEEEPDRIRLPAPGGPYSVWDEELFEHFFPEHRGARRRHGGTLGNFYRTLYFPDGERDRPRIPDAPLRGGASSRLHRLGPVIAPLRQMFRQQRLAELPVPVDRSR